MNLPKHSCGLEIKHNDHKIYYQTSEKRIIELDGLECPPHWKDESSKKRAIETNEVWEMIWFPRTPVTSIYIAAPTLEELLDFAKELESQ